MPLYVFSCSTHGRIDVLLQERRPVYLCERCGQLCERVSPTTMTRFGSPLLPTGDELPQLAESARRD
jgi:hypothetical protein